QTALGFAIYFNDLSPVFEEHRDYDVDTLLIYGDAPPPLVAVAVNQLLAQGICLRAERQIVPGLRYRRLLRLEDMDIAKEAGQC
ncbi:MAG: hypothetical protein GX572_00030, partial [Clostridia bacterium]|nr:hypothetical protein [Clostridia bacterium]